MVGQGFVKALKFLHALLVKPLLFKSSLSVDTGVVIHPMIIWRDVHIPFGHVVYV